MSDDQLTRRDYLVSSNRILTLISNADIRVDELHARIAEGEEVSAEQSYWVYQAALAELRGGLFGIIADAISAATRATVDAIAGGAR